MSKNTRSAIGLQPWTLLLSLWFAISAHTLPAQGLIPQEQIQPGRFDNGKMWTFDDPPVEYFQEAYGFRPDATWLEGVRLSTLRLPNCTASFVSDNGLVMTNHHCSREAGTAVQRTGEDFNKNGFYAKSAREERRVPDLYVDQLVRIADITDRVREMMAQGEGMMQLALRDSAFAQAEREYSQQPEWEGLVLETITFYNGGKYSLYGFKRHYDVRLVFLPELDLGFFGGDPDNFTYPRYALDCAFFRVYDDNGQPLKTSHFFKFNPTGISEGEVVFVVGNPGRTARLFTVADLEFDRDVQLPVQLTLLRNRVEVLKKHNETLKSDSVLNEIFSLENSIKAFNGRLQGLYDPYLMAKRRAFEQQFQDKVAVLPNSSDDIKGIWETIANIRKETRQAYPDLFSFQPNELICGKTLATGTIMLLYAQRLKSGMPAEQLEPMKNSLLEDEPYAEEVELGYLTAFLGEISQILGKDDPYLARALNGQTPQEAAKRILASTQLRDPSFRKSMFDAGPDAILQNSDPVMALANMALPRYMNAAQKNQQLNGQLVSLRGNLALLLFEVYGTSIPPDATFSLRINDGVVKGYPYNGTEAPYMTTYYGLYDRFHSFQKKYPWSLPARWQNPSKALLEAPVNFVSTNDIIGGNSGSPVVNRNREVVGLIFDGNIESLPGNYIYDDTYNRAVSVHAGGIAAALKFVYKTKRLNKELGI